MSEKTKNKKTAAASVVASVTATGILLSSLFSAPADIIKQNDRINVPFSVSDTLISNDDDDDGGEATLSEEKQKGIRASLRKRFLMLPVAFRAFLGVPVWCVGRIVIALLSSAWGSILYPALGVVLKYICIAALILAAFLVTVKAVSPDVPIKKILDRRNVFTVVICTALFGAAGAIVQAVWPESMKTYEIFESAVILIAIAFVALKIASISKKSKKEGAV